MCSNRQPLSMIFAGPSGNGKTELACWLAKLMNKPAEEDNFIKVDCGKLSDAHEIFGMSGAYQGAYEGSALNNFVLRMSQEPDAIGIVLLDEIEKASREVIHGLYQVIDKGEWTNKKLTKGRGTQTETIPCHNLVFIMTTNACDMEILEFSDRNQELYTTVGEDFEEIGHALESKIRGALRVRFPFTDAFIGRVGRIIPFLPMANGDPERQHLLLGEMMTVAKFLIERQQGKFSSSEMAVVDQFMTAKTKHRIAKIVVKDASCVRSIQNGVKMRMGDKMIHSLLLEKGGIQRGSQVEYYAKEEEMKVDFRATVGGSTSEVVEDFDTEDVDDEDMYA
jgi:ATP-dependent Clp protease ATP-binding subunit ClpA